MPANRVLLFYLTWINPVVAVAVLTCCLWSSLSGVIEGITESAGAGTSPPISSPFDDPFSMYFLGKGLFCSSLLFLFGLFFRSYLLQRASTARPE